MGDQPRYVLELVPEPGDIPPIVRLMGPIPALLLCLGIGFVIGRAMKE